MSGGRFATMTSSLLTRKGEARPSDVGLTNVEPQTKPQIDWREPALERLVDEQRAGEMVRNAPMPFRHQAAESLREDDISNVEFFSRGLGQSGPDKRHRVQLALTAAEYERLGIVAVKKGVNRNQLLRLAIDLYLEILAPEYKTDCACIATGEGCRNGCD